jgi:electron transfer flavoprotein alpha subunit
MKKRKELKTVNDKHDSAKLDDAKLIVQRVLTLESSQRSHLIHTVAMLASASVAIYPLIVDGILQII